MKKIPFLSNVKPINQQHLFAWLHSNLNRLSFHEWLDYSKANIRWILVQNLESVSPKCTLIKHTKTGPQTRTHKYKYTMTLNLD